MCGHSNTKEINTETVQRDCRIRPLNLTILVLGPLELVFVKMRKRLNMQVEVLGSWRPPLVAILLGVKKTSLLKEREHCSPGLRWTQLGSLVALCDKQSKLCSNP